MSVYDLYKPLRNYLRQFPLLDSLAVVHAYAQYLQFNRAFPPSVLNQKFLSTLGVDRDSAVTKPFDGGQDVVGGFGPAKGLGAGIAGVDVGRDGGLQRGGGAAGAALNLPVGEQGGEAIPQVDPA